MPDDLGKVKLDKYVMEPLEMRWLVMICSSLFLGLTDAPAIQVLSLIISFAAYKGMKPRDNDHSPKVGR